MEGATARTDPAGATATTDEEGWFALVIAQGLCRLRVWAAGYYPVMIPDVTCPLRQSSAPSNTLGEFEFGTGGAQPKHEAEERPSRLE